MQHRSTYDIPGYIIGGKCLEGSLVAARARAAVWRRRRGRSCTRAACICFGKENEHTIATWPVVSSEVLQHMAELWACVTGH